MATGLPMLERMASHLFLLHRGFLLNQAALLHMGALLRRCSGRARKLADMMICTTIEQCRLLSIAQAENTASGSHTKAAMVEARDHDD